MVTKETKQPGCGERAPGWYWTKLWPGAEWQPTKYHFEGGIIGETPEGFWRIHGQSGVVLDNSFAEIGPRIMPPTEPVNPGTTPNTESSSNTVAGAPGEAGRGQPGRPRRRNDHDEIGEKS